MEVELFRQKQVRPRFLWLMLIWFSLPQGRASDDKHADRAARQAERQRNEMLSSKKCVVNSILPLVILFCSMYSSSYIISIGIANQIKEKFYKEDVSNLENVSPPLVPPYRIDC